MTIDERIRKSPDFNGIIHSVIKKVFKVSTDCKKIYVDVNSCLSVVFRHKNDNIDLVQTEEVVYKVVEEFLMEHLSAGKDITLLFTLKPSKHHKAIFPDWCKYRNDRVKIDECDFIKKLIKSLHRFSKDNKQIKVYNTKEIHPAILVKYIETGNRLKCMVLSKDPVFQCMNLKHAIVFTGVHYIDPSDISKYLPDDIEQEGLDDSIVPVYLSLKGDIKNDFPGKEGYAKKKTVKYLQQYKLEIGVGLPHPLSEHTDKYSELYNVDNLLKKCSPEELDEIINKANKP